MLVTHLKFTLYKFTCCSLLVATRCLLIVTDCRNHLFEKNHLLLVAKYHSLLVMKLTRWKYCLFKVNKVRWRNFWFFQYTICFLKQKYGKLFQVNVLHWNLLLTILFDITICKWVKTQRPLALSQRNKWDLIKYLIYCSSLCQLTKTELFFFRVSLSNVNTCLNKILFMKTMHLRQKTQQVIALVTKINKIV